MHVTRQTISSWERGRSEPDIDNIRWLADYFEISTDELLSKGGVKMIMMNYRKGGILMLPFVTVGMVIAVLLQAPWMALCSIAFFGYVTAAVLMLLGKKAVKTKK